MAVVLIVGLLHVPAVQRSVLQATLTRVLPADLRVTLGGSSGSPLRGLTLTDVRASTPGDSTWLAVDTLRLEYDLVSVLGILHIQEISAGNLSFRVGRRADSSLVLPTFPESDSTRFPFDLDQVSAKHMSGSVVQDSMVLWTLNDGFLDLPSLSSRQDGFATTLRTLELAFTYPGITEAGFLSARAELGRDGVFSAGLRGKAPDSELDVELSGQLPRDGTNGGGSVEGGAAANARSLALDVNVAGHVGFADLQPFMATLRDDGRMDVEVTALVDADSIQARMMLDGGTAGLAVIRLAGTNVLPRDLTVHANLVGIRPNQLASDLPEKTLLNASAEASLALGETWAETLGRVDVAIEPGTLLGRRIGAGSAYAERADSTISWSGTVRAAGARLQTDGAWQMGPDLLSGTVALDNLTPEGLGIASPVAFTGGLRATISGTGASAIGASGSTPSWSASVELVDATVGACPVTSRGLRLRVPASALSSTAPGNSTTVHVQGELLACAEPLADLDIQASIRSSNQTAGQTAGQAAGAPSETRVWGRVRSGRAPLHQLLALADTTWLPGETTFDVTLDGPVQAQGQFTDVRAGGAVLDSLTVQVAGTLDALTFTAEAERMDGTARTRMHWLAADNQVNLTSLELEALDLASVLQIPHQSLVLSGWGSGNLEWPNGRLELALGGSHLNDVAFSVLDMDVRLAADSVKADIRARGDSTNEGTSADFTAGWYPTQDSLITASGSFGGLDLGAILGLDGQSSELKGDLDVRGRLQNGIPELEGRVSFTPGSRLNDFRVTTAELNVRLENGASSGKLVLKDDKGGITGSFGQNQGRMYANIHARDLDLVALTGLNAGTGAEPDAVQTSTLSAAVEANIQLSDGAWTEIVATGDSLRGHWGEFEVDDGTFGFHLDRTSLMVDSLLITGTDLRLDGRGSFARESSDFTLRATLPPALMRLPVVQETGLAFVSMGAAIRVSGPLEERRLVADLTAGGLRNASFYASEVKGRFLAEYGASPNPDNPDPDNPDTPTQIAPLDLRPVLPALLPAFAELTLESSVLDIPALSIQSSTVRVAWDGIDVTADADIQLTDTKSIGLSGILTTDAEPLVLTVDRLSADFDDQDWELAAPTRLTFGPTFSLSPFRLVAGNEQWIGAATISRGGVETHMVTLQRVQLSPFANLIDIPGLGGWASGEFIFSMPGETLAFQGALEGELQAFGQNVGTVTARLTRNNSDLVMDVLLTHPEGGQMTAIGSLPLGTPDGTVDFQVGADTYPIGWTRVFIDPLLVDDLRGSITGNVRVTGTGDAPSWAGNLQLRDGRIGLPELGKRRGLRYDGVEADLSFRADSVRVDRLIARSGSGFMEATGGIAMTDLQLGSVDIAFSANDFLAVDNANYRTVISGNGRLTGTTDRPQLGGDIDVVSADFYLSDEVSAGAYEAVTLSDADLLTLRERFGMRISAEDTTAFDFYRVLAIDDLTIRMQRDTWVRSKSNPEMDIQISGRLDVDKSRNSDPDVFGNIEVLPERSQIKQFGRKFNIERGTLTFNGPIASPIMDLQASYDVPSRSAGGSEVIIRLNVSGTPEDLEVTFDSDPAMELADIVSYIATGRPASSSFQLGSQNDSYLQSAAGLAMGPLTDLVENMAGSGLGLDVIEIAHTGTQGLTLTAGKYVSPKLYVSVSQPIALSTSSESSTTGGENETQVAVEYEIIRQLLLTLINRGTILRVNLRWEYAF